MDVNELSAKQSKEKRELWQKDPRSLVRDLQGIIGCLKKEMPEGTGYALLRAQALILATLVIFPDGLPRDKLIEEVSKLDSIVRLWEEVTPG